MCGAGCADSDPRSTGVVVLAAVMWLGGDPVNGVGLALLLADIVALIWLLTNQRLRACFSFEKKNNGTFGGNHTQPTLINKEGSEMKSLRLTLLALPLALTGCSTLLVNWSAANPWNWFGSSTKSLSKALGALTAATPLELGYCRGALEWRDYRL